MSDPLDAYKPAQPMQPVECVLDGIHLTLIGCWLYLAAAAAGWLPPTLLFQHLMPAAGDPPPVMLYVLLVVVVADYPILWLQLRKMAQARADQGALPLTTRVAMRAAFAAAPLIYFLVYALVLHH